MSPDVPPLQMSAGWRALLTGPESRILRASMTTQLLGLVITVLSARLLSTEDFGALTGALILITLVPMALSAGLQDACVTCPQTDTRLVYSSVRSSLLLNCLLVAVVTALATGARSASTATLLAVLAGLSAAASFLTSVVLSLEQRLEAFGDFARLLVLSNVITLALVVALGPLGQIGVAGTASVVLAARLVGNVVPLVLRGWRRRHYFSGHVDVDLRTSLLRRGLRFQGTAVLAVLSSRLDQVVALRALQASELAAYGLVLPLVNGLRVVSGAVGSVGLVRVTLAQPAHRWSVLRGQLHVAAAACTAMALALLAASAVLLPLAGFRGPGVLPATALFLASGALGVVLDVLIRMLRGADVVLPGLVGRAVGLVLFLALTLVVWGTVGLELLTVAVISTATSAGALVVVLALSRRALMRLTLNRSR